MSEWLKVHAWKACMGETPSRVQIPLSPQIFGNKLIRQSTSILLLFISLCFSSGESFGYIHNFSGDVFLESNDEKRLILPAISGRNITNGNIIRVKEDSFCEIYSNDKRTFIRLDSDTDVKFIETEKTREIYLKDGSLYISNKNPDISKKAFVFSDFSQMFDF